MGQLGAGNRAHSQKRWNGVVRYKVTYLVLQKAGPAPLLCVMGVHSVKEVLGWSLEGGREIAFLTQANSQNLHTPK